MTIILLNTQYKCRSNSSWLLEISYKSKWINKNSYKSKWIGESKILPLNCTVLIQQTSGVSNRDNHKNNLIITKKSLCRYIIYYIIFKIFHIVKNQYFIFWKIARRLSNYTTLSIRMNSAKHHWKLKEDCEKKYLLH